MRWAAVLAGVLALAPAGRVHAYLMDGFDARVVEPGTLELELQPLGYFVIDDGEAAHYLVTPSMLAYLGIAPRFDLIVLWRGHVRAAGPEVMPRFHTRDTAVDLRWLVVSGTYDGGGEGPSFALQAGVLPPNLGWDPSETIGAHVGAIFSWQWANVGTVHVNVWGARTPWRSWDLFTVIGLEAPAEWSVRPAIEAWWDHDTSEERGGDLPSVLAGVNIDLTESAIVSVGARYAEWDGYREIEVRASLWLETRVWGEDAEPVDPELVDPGT
jgi:hypothetical protein